MSSSVIFEPGFGNSRQRPRWWRDNDGAWATTVNDITEDVAVVWDLTDYLASAETVSSAAYQDSGATSSAKSVATPQVLFTLTGVGDTKVTATLSTGRHVVQRFRLYEQSCGGPRRDYGNERY